MGQRLVIHAYVGEKAVGSVYYHWSAYTTSALAEAVDLYNNFDDALGDAELSLNNAKCALIHACEKNGGGIDGGVGSYEWIHATRMFPQETFQEHPDRNQGLVCITDTGMVELSTWEEGGLDLDLLTGQISNFTVLDSYDDVNEALVDYDLTMEEVQKHTFHFPDTFNVSDVESLINQLDNLRSFYWMDGDTFYTMIN